MATTFSGRHWRKTLPMHAVKVVLPTPPLPDTNAITYCLRMCRRMRSRN